MPMTRRDLLAGTAALGLTALVTGESEASAPKAFRVAHMTDFHVQPELRAPAGMEAALKHAMRQKPHLVMLGGDLVMDSFSATEARTATQWKIFQSLLAKHVKVPCHYCIGNHDIWGWDKLKSKTSGTEKRWGKKWFLEIAGLKNTYYSFDAGGWKWIVLDTVQPADKGYEGYVDPTQLSWLKSELDKTPKSTPVIVVSHVPLFSPSPMVYGFNAEKNQWQVSTSEVTKNFNDVKKLFDMHTNVKLCLSGHIHLVDRYDYNGVSYLCNGAVCGAWWLGKNRDFEPGYVVIDLYSDGTFKQQFVKWGWKPE